MGSEVEVASRECIAGQATPAVVPVPPSVSKKTLAVWKRQLRNLKTKDVGKKTDGLRYCAQDEQFVREQSEVLPLLIDLLSRVKTPEVVAETLRMFRVLFTQTEAVAVRPASAEATSESAPMVQLHPEQNRQFFLDASCDPSKSAWHGGEPFVLLFSANVSAEIKIQAIEVFTALLNHSTQIAVDFGQADHLRLLQTSGTPAVALLACIAVDHPTLQLAAIECMSLLFRNPPDEAFLSVFNASEGLQKIQPLAQRPECRFHSAVLNTMESFSHHAIGREYLRASGAANAICMLLVSTVETTSTVFATAAASPTTPVALIAEEAELMHANVSLACRSYARILFAKEVAHCESLVGEFASAAQVVEALVAILQRDISSVVSPPPPPVAPAGSNAAAQAAAAAAAVASTLASLFAFSSSKCIDIITALGRMVEKSGAVKQHAKAKGILPVLLLAFRVPSDDALHQSADKLIHLCSRVTGTPVDGSPGLSGTLLVPQLFASASNESQAASLLISPENVLPTLESAAASDDVERQSGVIFRLVRWLAVVVDAPENTQALGEAAMAVLTKILLQTTPSETVLCGFISKCLRAIALQSPEACEICGSEGRNPIGVLVAVLSTAYAPIDPMPPHRAASVASEIETLAAVGDEKSEQTIAAEEDALVRFKLEWLTEFDELETFEGDPLTQNCHAFDAFLFGAQAIEALAAAYSGAKSETSASVDFADLLSQRIDAIGKNPAATTAVAKKKAGEAGAKLTSAEGVVLCVLEKTGDVFRLLDLFSSRNGEVAVSLLTTIKTLLQLPGGVRAMLALAKAAMEVQPVEERSEEDKSEPASPPSTWPWTREEAQRTEHAWLLAPILSVFETPVTCFYQLEAAVGVLTAMVDDGSDATASAPLPTSGVISSVEIPTSDSDRFLNAALSHGMLAYLVAVLDGDRVPLSPKDASRRETFAQSAVALAQIFINRGALKQAQAVARRQELLGLQDQTAAAAAAAASAGSKSAKQEAGPTIDVASIHSQKLEYKSRWASDLLDAAFTLPRFDYLHVPVLLLATQIGHNDIARALLEAGASPDAPTSLDSTTPLMLALLTKNNELIQSLLKAGASVDAITNDGRDASVWMCALASPLREDLALLVSRIHSSTIGTKLVLPLDAMIELDSEDGKPDLDLLETLLDRGMDVNVSNTEGDFMLHALLSQCVVRKRIRGLDVCFRYTSTRHIGADALAKLVSVVVETHRADLNACNRLGQTPLHVALLHGHTHAVLYLLEHGANPNVRDAFGMLPLHYACLGFFSSPAEARQIISALQAATPKYELIQGVFYDLRKYKTRAEKAAVEVDALLERGFADVVAPPALVRTLATVEQVLSTASEPPDGFLPWHLACGACSHLNASRLCLSDEMHSMLQRNGEIRAAILAFLLKTHNISLTTRTTKQLTGLHLAVKTDVDGSNGSVIDVLLASPELRSILNAVHEPTLIDSLTPIAEGAVIELTTAELLYAPHAHVSTRSLTHKYHVILPDGTHFEDIERHQLKLSSAESVAVAPSRYTLRLESAFSALHYAVQVSDDLSRRLLGLQGIALQPEGSDLPLLALACAAKRSPDIVSRLVNAQANVRVHLPLHDGSSNEQSDAGGASAGRASRGASRKQAAALHFAVMYEDAELVRSLVARQDYTNVNVRRSGDGFTPLHLACGMGNMEITKLLLDQGANFIQMSTVSSTHSGLTPLHLLLKADGVENEKLKELIDDGYLKREMLLEGLGAPAVVPPKAAAKPDEQSQSADGTSTPLDGREADEVNENEIEISCVLLDEEEHNLSLYNHVQQLLARRRDATGYGMRIQTELVKSDEVLTLFFNLISPSIPPRGNSSSLTHVAEEDPHLTGSPRPLEANPQRTREEELSIREASHQFSQLRHWHDCYAQQQVRSQWVETIVTSRMMQRSSFNRRSTNELLALGATDP